ncbi:MAG: GAF domain-containing protein, partial [Gammaproteobacteria bacterium]
INIGRSEVGLFPDKVISLLQTFADQAVIAIENVRLFNETKEALERQTAMSEVLRVISESPSDVQPVFDAICERAIALCQAKFGIATRFDGEWVHLQSAAGLTPGGLEALRATFPVKPGCDTVSGRAVAERVVIQSADYQSEYGTGLAKSLAGDGRSVLAMPLLREGKVLGTINIGRSEVGLFPDKSVSLLQTFADQAVIAIENVRLFNETKEALEQQTAMSEVLRVISESPTEVQPVFDAILERAIALCHAKFGIATRFDGERVHLQSAIGLTPSGLEAMRAAFPVKPGRDTVSGRAVAERAIIQSADYQSEYGTGLAKSLAGDGRGLLAMPLLRESNVLGTITIGRSEAGLFPEKLVRLLQTFADQAVIAIENVRLFNETKEALDQQTAISDILRATTESPTDVQPVLEAIANHAVQLCDAASASIFLIEDNQLKHVTSRGALAAQTES